MISEQEVASVRRLAEKYGAQKVILFGSSVSSEDAQDIDLGVLGVSHERFYEFYGELMFELSKSVDVVDLSSPTMFSQLVLDEGVSIYG